MSVLVKHKSETDSLVSIHLLKKIEDRTHFQNRLVRSTCINDSLSSYSCSYILKWKAGVV